MMFLLIVWALSIPIVGQAACTDNGGGVWTAASIARTDVNDCLTASSLGDTINVPAGSASWSGGITLTGRTLIGSTGDYCTESAGTVTCGSAPDRTVTAGLVTITKHATHYTKLIGFNFSGTDQHYVIGGSESSKAYVLGNNRFNAGSTTTGSVQVNGGLFYGTLWVQSPASNSDTLPYKSDTPGWSGAFTAGTLDTTGEANTYIETSRYEGFLEVSADCDDGAKIVFRHVTFVDSSTVSHGGGNGTSGNDTSIEGCRFQEIYDSKFDRVSNGVAVNKWVWIRGGGLVFRDNSVEDASSPDGSSFPNKSEIQLGVGCEVDTTHPIGYQTGQSSPTPDATPDFPVVISGNTGAGAVSGNFIELRANDSGGGGHGCGSPGTYIQLDRDYVTTNTWHTKYTYPHPLISGGGSGGDGTASINESIPQGTRPFSPMINLFR